MGPGFLRSMTSSDETVVILNNKRIGYDDFPSHSSRWNVHLNTSEVTEPSLSPHCIVPPKKRFLTIDLRSAGAAGHSRPSPHTEPAAWQCWHTRLMVMITRREGGMGGWRIGEGQHVRAYEPMHVCFTVDDCCCFSSGHVLAIRGEELHAEGRGLLGAGDFFVEKVRTASPFPLCDYHIPHGFRLFVPGLNRPGRVVVLTRKILCLLLPPRSATPIPTYFFPCYFHDPVHLKLPLLESRKVYSPHHRHASLLSFGFLRFPPLLHNIFLPLFCFLRTDMREALAKLGYRSASVRILHDGGWALGWPKPATFFRKSRSCAASP